MRRPRSGWPATSQPVPTHQCAESCSHRFWKVKVEEGYDRGIVTQIRGDQLTLQVELGVGEQHRQLRAGEARVEPAAHAQHLAGRHVRALAFQPPAAITVVMDMASRGLCSSIARNTPSPTTPTDPSAISACMTAPRAIPSITVCTPRPRAMPSQLTLLAGAGWL